MALGQTPGTMKFHTPFAVSTRTAAIALVLALAPLAHAQESTSAQASRFDIQEFEIEGNSVLPVTMVEKAVQPFLGPDKTLVDMEGARAALEKLYQETGYISVYVEEATGRVPEDGIVRLKVVEGTIGRVKVTGSQYHSQAYIRDKVPEMEPGKVPNFTVAQAQLADLNRTEERRVQPVVKPGQLPETVDVELQVIDQLPMQFNVELNNRQVQFTEPWRLQATARYNNLWQADHALSVTAITTPQDIDQSKVLALSYTIPLQGSDAWLGYAVLSDSLVEPLGSANVVGKGFVLGLKRIWGLPGSNTFQHTLAFGVDYKDSQERIKADGSELSSPLRYVPIKLDYNANAQTEDTSSTLALGGVFALRGVVRESLDCAETGPVDQFACKREGGDGSFAALTIDATHTRPLWRGAFGGWQTRWRLGAQVTNQPLVGGEQFSIGGVDSVRGYYEAEAIGDVGVHTGVELRSPNVAKREGASWSSFLNELQGLAFVEGGLVRTFNPGFARARTGLASAGVGLKLRARKVFSAQVDVAWPLRATEATQKNDPRVHARLGLDF
jgi:hemolysin activation/secretion protein